MSSRLGRRRGGDVAGGARRGDAAHGGGRGETGGRPLPRLPGLPLPRPAHSSKEADPRSVCVCVLRSVLLSVHLLTASLSISVISRQLDCLSVHPSIDVSLYTSIYPSVCLPIYHALSVFVFGSISSPIHSLSRRAKGAAEFLSVEAIDKRTGAPRASICIRKLYLLCAPS